MSFLKFFGLGNKKEYGSIEETMNTTLVGEDSSILDSSYRYNIPTLTDYLKDHPKSCFAHYMLAELLLDQGSIREAKKEFLLGQENENEASENTMTKEERKLKKKAKSKLEKQLGYKL
jgi:arylamine N-acetyltransferase